MVCGNTSKGRGKIAVPGVCVQCKADACRQLASLRDLIEEVEQTKRSVEKLLSMDVDCIDVTPEDKQK